MTPGEVRSGKACTTAGDVFSLPLFYLLFHNVDCQFIEQLREFQGPSEPQGHRTDLSTGFSSAMEDNHAAHGTRPV
jgi:hypothetical protein